MSSRRALLRSGAALTTAAWVAPTVLTLDRAAAATPSGGCEIPTMSNGGVWLSTPPGSLAEGGVLDSPNETYAFLEQGPVTLASDLAVNRTTAGTFGGNSNQNAIVAAGTTICSYYVHGDRLDDSGTLTGTMQFSSHQIVGLIYRTGQMNASNFLRNPATTYVQGPMEGNDSMTMSLATGANTLSWSMRFGPHLDQIRVITSC
jgi:hypothetical protein